MIRFTTIIKRFESQGEKTGWTYILFPDKAIAALKPATKTSFRIKGRLDTYQIEKAALIPMGGGKFILPLNATIRKAIKKGKDATLDVAVEEDKAPLEVNEDFTDCMNDEPAAVKTFGSFTRSHQLYFSKWIESAKTETTKAKRIAMAVNALAKGWGYPEMLRAAKKDKTGQGL